MVESQVGFEKVTLFRQEAPGGLTYRIPALLYLPSESAFLAFAEERSSPRDEDAKFLVMRRGQKEGTSVKWGPQETLMMATLPKYRTMNPCPVYEEQSGTVFLFFICVLDHITAQHQLITGKNAVRFCYIVSQDGGRTWNQATDVTQQVMGDSRNWATCALGPGHGVHDDGGQNWARGQFLKLPTSECQVAEVTCWDDNHLLYINARNSGRGRCRAEALSLDRGNQFERGSLCKELCEPPKGCQGSVVSFTPVPEMLSLDPKACPVALGRPYPAVIKSWLVFSHPTSRHKRVDLGIYLSIPIKRGRWEAPWVLNKGPSGYSDLAVCQEGKSFLFACLFECGVSDPCEEIAVQLFTDVELLRNVSSNSSCST
uniref:exo-alpha-sialidase n=1 Tax=Salvator merianae TaxID=96440 RepID=A0A8D0BJH0_SALMN